jgi:signal transduction histidine kinase
VQLLREALSNIVRHANASEVHVTLQESPSQILLRITDNGDGFDPESVKLGNGLNNMRQRVAKLNGTVNIESQERQGTTLTFVFPVT